jgi:hypothetical protein
VLCSYSDSKGETLAANGSRLLKANEVEATFRLSEGLYLIGIRERGVTLYNQQVRAHNVIWSLGELDRYGARKLGNVAVVGGGAAGITAVAALLALYKGRVPITLFERLWDLCPLQQGADTRWVHPRIYGWPAIGSRAPSASLPILNWSEGRASDVARTLVREFGEHCQEFITRPESLVFVMGLRDFRLHTVTRTISWIGTRAELTNPFFRRGNAEGNEARFDTIILTAGFGLERESQVYRTVSYCRNEQIAQPILDGTRRNYVISGYGDGALVDLCRLTIERFRQDTIVYELFGQFLDNIEAELQEKLDEIGIGKNIYDYFKSIDQTMISDARKALGRRIRKDTNVTLHISGSENNIKSFSEIFGQTSSFLNC